MNGKEMNGKTMNGPGQVNGFSSMLSQLLSRPLETSAVHSVQCVIIPSLPHTLVPYQGAGNSAVMHHHLHGWGESKPLDGQKTSRTVYIVPQQAS